MQWDQLRDLLALQDRLDGLLGGGTNGWMPAVDLYETADQYVVIVELPGLKRDDIEIEVREDRLHLRGARRPPAGEPPRYLQLERGHGQFARRFAFAEAVDTEHVSADFREGVLTVTVPKQRQSASRRISVE